MTREELRELREMADDYWRDRSVVELALFLATGKVKPLLALSSSDCLLQLHTAYVFGFTSILQALIEATFSQVGNPLRDEPGKRTASTRLKDFTRQSICGAIYQAGLWGILHPNAVMWLEGNIPEQEGGSVSPRPKRAEMWLDFLSSREIDQNSLSTDAELELWDEFNETVYFPADRAHSGEDWRRAWTSACQHLRDERKEVVEKAREVKENKRLYSPEINERRKDLFYADVHERLSLRFGVDTDKNNSIVRHKAEDLHSTLENIRESKNPRNLLFLLDDDGAVPSVDEMYRRITDGQWLHIE